MELKPIRQKVWRTGNAMVITIDSVLCEALGIEEGDFIWTKIEKIEKPSDLARTDYHDKLKSKVKIKSGDNIKIILPEAREEGNTPTWREFRLIPLHKKNRYFFPGYKIQFEVVTEMGTITIHPTSARKGTSRGDPKGGYYLKGKGLTEWFDKHDELEPGNKLIFTVIEPFKKYKLSIEN